MGLLVGAGGKLLPSNGSSTAAPGTAPGQQHTEPDLVYPEVFAVMLDVGDLRRVPWGLPCQMEPGDPGHHPGWELSSASTWKIPAACDAE